MTQYKVFVGGVAWETVESDFTELFSQFGPLTDSVVMIDKDTGKSRGFGFVTYANESDMHKCLQMNRKLVLNNRTLDLKQAIPRDECLPSSTRGDRRSTDRRRSRSRSPPRRRPPPPRHGIRLFVGGLSPMVETEDLYKHFSRFGRLVDCIAMVSKDTGKKRGFGFVTVEDDATVDAIFGEPHVLDGRRVDVHMSKDRYRARPPLRPPPRGRHYRSRSPVRYSDPYISRGGSDGYYDERRRAPPPPPPPRRPTDEHSSAPHVYSNDPHYHQSGSGERYEEVYGRASQPINDPGHYDGNSRFYHGGGQSENGFDNSHYRQAPAHAQPQDQAYQHHNHGHLEQAQHTYERDPAYHGQQYPQNGNNQRYDDQRPPVQAEQIMHHQQYQHEYPPHQQQQPQYYEQYQVQDQHEHGLFRQQQQQQQQQPQPRQQGSSPRHHQPPHVEHPPYYRRDEQHQQHRRQEQPYYTNAGYDNHRTPVLYGSNGSYDHHHHQQQQQQQHQQQQPPRQKEEQMQSSKFEAGTRPRQQSRDDPRLRRHK